MPEFQSHNIISDFPRKVEIVIINSNIQFNNKPQLIILK